MNIYKYKFIIMSIVLSIAMFLSGCSEYSWESSDELVFGTILSTKSLDPAKDYNGWFTVRYGIGETLFKLDDYMNVVPNLAEGYENIDEKTWKIKIREGVTFQNGELMTPDKVKISLERTSELNKRADDTLKIEYITTDNWNLIVKTREPNPTLVNDLCDPFASIMDVSGTDDFDNNPVGTGPFKVKQFNPIKSSCLEKYDDYWQGEPKLDKVKIIHVSDADTLTMALQTGEIDVAQGIPYSSMNMFEDNPLYRISGVDTSRVILMYYNYNNPLLNDKILRKAINMSVNKEEYASILLKGSASATEGPFPEGMPYGGNSVNSAKYNVSAAKKALNDAGYEDTDNDGVLEKHGQKLAFKIVTYSSRAELPIIAQAIQSDLKDIGISVSVEISDNIMDILNNRKFDIALYSNVTAATGDPYAYLNNLIISGGASNYGGYYSKKAEELLKIMEGEFNKDMRDELAVDIVQESLNDEGFNFIAHLRMNFIMKSNVVNFNIHGTDYYQFNWNTDIVNYG
ncbi:ABC transporter substrate-binding protein [uncultured Clostridium sp.]|uniref:ABC transporter substrate-binding protein n=1 Tax=uncultured Clostridium sp. TaxID=59620 RepID=UPI0025E472EE|nr:ABC transporter substrate-binding protein [uncultured Clostridium sp.]